MSSLEEIFGKTGSASFCVAESVSYALVAFFAFQQTVEKVQAVYVATHSLSGIMSAAIPGAFIIGFCTVLSSIFAYAAYKIINKMIEDHQAPKSLMGRIFHQVI